MLHYNATASHYHDETNTCAVETERYNKNKIEMWKKIEFKMN